MPAVPEDASSRRCPTPCPGATLGNRALVLSAWLHYGLGNTLSQIVDVFNHHLQLKVTPGGLVADVAPAAGDPLRLVRADSDARPWRRPCCTPTRPAGGSTARRTGCGASRRHELTYYLIDRSRGSRRCAKFFIEEFAGALVTDFWGAYNAVVVRAAADLPGASAARPGTRWRNTRTPGPTGRRSPRSCGGCWATRSGCGSARSVPAEEYASRRARLDRATAGVDRHRLGRHARQAADQTTATASQRLVYLPGSRRTFPSTTTTPNGAIRPAVIIRKNSYGNRSQRGADTQAVLMSVFRTLKQRGHDPIRTIVAALEQFLLTGQLPSLPPKITSDG